MSIAEQLQHVATEDLAEEVARRLRAGAPSGAAVPAPPPPRGAGPGNKLPKKRSVWAREKAAGLRQQLEEIMAERVIGEKELQRKQQAISANRAEIDKFERIAKAAERRGE